MNSRDGKGILGPVGISTNELEMSFRINQMTGDSGTLPDKDLSQHRVNDVTTGKKRKVRGF